MPLAVWLDGVFVKQDLTQELYRLYSGHDVKISPSEEFFEDLEPLLNFLRKKDFALLSPYTKKETEVILNSLELRPFVTLTREDTSRTKPSGEPVKKLLDLTRWDPVKLALIGSSPIDLLSVRYSDSRIKVVCITRFIDCSTYTPFLFLESIESLVKSLIRLGFA